MYLFLFYLLCKVYDGAHLISSNQPRYNSYDQVWSRPILLSLSANLQIVFHPPVKNDDVRQYHGFKLECSAKTGKLRPEVNKPVEVAAVLIIHAWLLGRFNCC